MFEYDVLPSKYRFVAPLLISVVSAALFMPFYFSIANLCSRFPDVENCMPESIHYLACFFLAMFLFGILLSSCRAYKDFYRSKMKVSGRNSRKSR